MEINRIQYICRCSGMLSQLDNYYFNLPEPQKSCLIFLRGHLLDFNAAITEHWKYGTAFFHFKGKQFCYFSISKKTGRTYIGFVHGDKFYHPLLEKEGRTQVKVYYVDPEKDLDLKTVKRILEKAIKMW